MWISDGKDLLYNTDKMVSITVYRSVPARIRFGYGSSDDAYDASAKSYTEERIKEILAEIRCSLINKRSFYNMPEE